MEEFYREIPKAELHLHLEGSPEPSTLKELAPGLTDEEIRRRYGYRDFGDFILTFKWILKMLRGPAEYALVTRRLLERLHQQNVRYAEITLSAGAVLWREMDFGAVFDAVVREGENSPVEVRWILDAIRQFGPEHGMEVARLAVERADRGVVAFGIGGDEAAGPAEWFGRVFRFVKDKGLHLTVHAGETVGAESVCAALDGGADRIGHGIRAVEDPALLTRLREKNIPLDICISSNVATGTVNSLEDHPLRKILDAGVQVTLNTDDPGMFGTTLLREYSVAERELGLSRDELVKLAANGFRYAFAKIMQG